jgi:glucose uptake protein
MILPQSFVASWCVLILGLLCLGSWANTFKMAGKWRYELYYFDFAFGAFFGAVILALTFGSLGFDGFSFRDSLLVAGKREWVLAFAAGVLFNFGNLLMMSALSLTGMSIAFAISASVGMIVETVVAFSIRRYGPFFVLLLACALLIGAICIAALAWRYVLIQRHEQTARAGKARTTRKPGSAKAVVLAVIGGGLLGSFATLVDGARSGDVGLGPYALAVVFSGGVVLSTFLLDLFLMNLPVEGEPLEILEYLRGNWRSHLLGFAGGMIWAAGLVAVLVVAAAPPDARPGVAPLYALTKGGAVLAILWGLYGWNEQRAADGRIRVLQGLMTLLILGAVVLLALAPLSVRS